MKKVLLSLAIVTIATLSANAQSDSKSGNPLKLDVGVTGGLPTGNFGDAYSFGIGGYAKGSYNVAENIDLTLTADYKSFSGKTITETFGGQTVSEKAPAYGIFSVLAGATYLVDGGFHIDGGIGFGSLSAGGGSASGFAYRVGIGYTASEVLDITANYNGVSANGGSISYIGFGVGYRFVK
jgi:hypothetical protein